MMKINPRDMERAMKKMGMQTETIDAEEVIIRTPEKEIVISSPQVTKVMVMGQTTFQIMGQESERGKGRFSADDVKLVMQKTGKGEAAAKKALEEEGDIASAILKLLG
jgi:nascent polypeptide-associated complex subunit alpha